MFLTHSLNHTYILTLYFAVNSLFSIPVESVCQGTHEPRVVQPALDPAPVGTVTGRAPVF